MHPVAILNTIPPSSDDITGTHRHGGSPSTAIACQWTFVQSIMPRKVVPLLLLAPADSEAADPRPQGVARPSQAFPSRLYTCRYSSLVYSALGHVIPERSCRLSRVHARSPSLAPAIISLLETAWALHPGCVLHPGCADRSGVVRPRLDSKGKKERKLCKDE